MSLVFLASPIYLPFSHSPLSPLLVRMAAAQGERPRYKDASAPVEARVRDLLGRMTLREKAGQMAQIELFVALPRALTELGVSSLLNGGGSPPRERASPSDWAGMVDGMQRLALSSRLGVPIIYGIDAVHGNNNVIGATIFPHNVGLGASRYPLTHLSLYMTPVDHAAALAALCFRPPLDKKRSSRTAPR